MKFRRLLLTGVAILTVHLGSLPRLAVQAQEPRIISPSRQAGVDMPPLPKDFGLPVSILPVPSPDGIPPGGTEMLGIADLEAIALATNPTIAQAGHRVAALQGKYLQVGLRPNPVIGYQGEEIGDVGTAGQQGMFVGQRFVTANARQQIEQYKTEILPDATSSLDLTRQGYQQGEFGYLELLTAQRTYFRVNLAYLESLRELWTSAVQIEGLLLTGGLAPPGT